MARRVVTFFVVHVPDGFTPRRWGQKYRSEYGFDYDNRPPARDQLLVWPNEIAPATLRHALRLSGVRFKSFRGNPERMFNVSG